MRIDEPLLDVALVRVPRFALGSTLVELATGTTMSNPQRHNARFLNLSNPTDSVSVTCTLCLSDFTGI
jgi:hypothetical protein